MALRLQSAKQSFVEFPLKCRFLGQTLMAWPRNLHWSGVADVSGPWSCLVETRLQREQRELGLPALGLTLWAWSSRPGAPGEIPDVSQASPSPRESAQHWAERALEKQEPTVCCKPKWQAVC